jgi:hypothetical protein
MSWIRQIADFVGRVESAAALLSSEYDRPRLFDRIETADVTPVVVAGDHWKNSILNSAFQRLSEILIVLDDADYQKARSEPIDLAAFDTLAGITTTHRELLDLRQQDPMEALRELVKQLQITRQQIAATAVLKSKVANHANSSHASERARIELLEKAGGAIGLTEAAGRLKISRQALHKKVYAGNALGMMQDDKIILPKLQFVTEGGETKILSGIDRVAKDFNESKAGPFSALQFLIEVDPNLGARPIDVLTTGDVDAVHHAAQAYLSMNDS